MLIGGDEWGRMLEIGVAPQKASSSSSTPCPPARVLEVMSMPRSIQEILDYADELAKSFEDYDPAEGDQVPVEVSIATCSPDPGPQ
jgi:hypothetical protein